MRKINFTQLFSLILLLIVVSSCTKNPNEPSYTPKRVGFYLLGEGQMGKANSTLSIYIDATSTLIKDYFESLNNSEKIGDTANDMIVYGAKSYIVVNVDNKVIISDIYTGKKIKEIDLGKEGNSAMSPRYAASANGKVFVTTYYGGVIVIDTVSMSVSNKIALTGAFSEGITQMNNKLYVANSGNKGDSFGGKGTTISVIDVVTEKEVDAITVPINPNRVVASKNNTLFVSTWGDWSKIDAQIHSVDIVTKTVTTIPDLTASRMAVTDSYLYTFHFSYIDFKTYVKKYDLNSKVVSTVMEDPAVNGFKSIYDVNTDPVNGDVYYLDESGLVVVYDKTGVEKLRLADAGRRVNKVVFISM